MKRTAPIRRLAASLLVWAVLVTGADAQVVSGVNSAPPTLNPKAQDGNGVDLTSRAYSFASPFALGAPGAGHLSVRTELTQSDLSNTLIPSFFIDSTDNGGYGMYWEVTSNIGGKSRKFDCDGYATGTSFTCTPVFESDGTTMGLTGTITSTANGLRGHVTNCVETLRDGTVYTLQCTTTQSTAVRQSRRGLLQSVLYPNGEKLTAAPYPMDWYTTTTMSSNLGYSIAQTYSGTTSDTYTLANGATSLATLSISQSSTGSTTGNVVETDALSRTFQSSWNTGCRLVTSQTSPGGIVSSIVYDTTANTTYGVYPVKTVTRGGKTWTYTANVAAGTVTVTDPISRTTVATATPTRQTDYDPNAYYPCPYGQYAYGRITNIADGLSRNTGYQYNVNNDLTPLLTNVNLPEGNGDVYEYDARQNVTKITKAGKTGSTPSTIIVFQAGYDTSCTNQNTCNQPNWTKDANGNQTDFTYYSHGGVKTATLPADAAGLRRRSYYTYEAYDTGNGIIYRPTRIETCGLSSAQLSLTACPAQVTTAVTTTAYWNKTFLPLTVTQTDGASTLSATTTYTYDNWGRPVTVDGPRTDVDDKVYATYDAASRKICEIGVDPDGTGPLVRTMVRHTYNGDNQETKTETGYGSSTTDCTPGTNMTVTAFTRNTYDAVTGRLSKTEQVQP